MFTRNKPSLRDSILDLNTTMNGGGSTVSIHNVHKLIIYDDSVSIDNNEAGAIYIPIIDDTIITRSVVAETITKRRRLLATVSDLPPVMDSVSIDTINSGPCDGLQIVINDALYGCIAVTMLDSFGDGLSYGDGTYWVSWKDQFW
eukprot:269450_1